MKYYCYSCVARIGDAALTPVVRLPVALEMCECFFFFFFL